MASHHSTLVSELNALLRLTHTETVIAEARRGQATSQDIERELAGNADDSRERARLITAAIRELEGLPNVVGVAGGRLAALAKIQAEQGQALSDALLSDLALEQQLQARARFLKVLAEAGDQRGVARLADRLDRAHAETIDWIETRLAEVGIGGPAALRPTPVQRVVGLYRQSVWLPYRGTAVWLNYVAAAARSLGRRTAETLEQQLDRAATLREAAGEVVTAGRNAALKRAERAAREEGATDTAKAIHSTRATIGGLESSELPIRGYDQLNATEAVERIRELTDSDDVRAILAYEEAHGSRRRVVSAATSQLAAIGREAFTGEEPDRPASRSTRTERPAPRRAAPKRTSTTPAQRRAKLAEKTVDELREQAARKDVEGRSAMNKDELVGALAKS